MQAPSYGRAQLHPRPAGTAAAATVVQGSHKCQQGQQGQQALEGAEWAGDYWGAWQRRVQDPVASTARWIAAQRAREHRHPQRLFEDRFAEALAGEEGFAFRDGQAPIAIGRTRFADDFVLESCQRRAIRQVVNLGAGMDTRAVRLPFPHGVACFELDKPSLFDIKEPLLQPMLTAEERALCKRVVIPVDFEQPPVEFQNEPDKYWAKLLQQSGFNADAPSCWVLEGLVYYLPPEAVEATLKRVAALSAPGSTIFFDMVNDNFLQQERQGWHLRDLEQRQCPWKWGHNDPAAMLADLGFQANVLDLRDLEVDRANCRLVVHGGTSRAPVGQSSAGLTYYVTAVRT